MVPDQSVEQRGVNVMPGPDSILAAVAWPKGIDYSHEKQLIESGTLTFNKLGGQSSEFIFLTREAAVEEYTTAANTTHWYRGMPKEEFDELFKWNIVKATDDSYTGIAPYRGYVKTKFFKNESRGSHIVEFGNTVNLSFDEDFSIYRQFHSRGFSVKAEGGGTFGLGGAGSRSAQQEKAVGKFGTAAAVKGKKYTEEQRLEQLSALKSPSDLFTEWLVSKKIYRKLVDLRLPAKKNAAGLLGV